MEKIAITGIGIVSPSGLDKRKFWSNIKAGRSAVEKITRFDSSKYSSQVAGHVHELDAYSNVSSRLLKKIDVFSRICIVAFLKLCLGRLEACTNLRKRPS